MTLQPSSNQVVRYYLKTNAKIVGTELAGITATGIDPAENSKQVNSLASYVIGVSLSEQDALKLDRLKISKIESGNYNCSNAFKVTISNNYPQLIQHAKMRVKIFHGGRLYQSKEYPDINIAPNTPLACVIPHKNLQTGKYRMDVNIQSGQQKVRLHQTFTPLKLSNQARSHEPLMIAVLMTVEIWIIFWICRMIYHKKKNKKN